MAQTQTKPKKSPDDWMRAITSGSAMVDGKLEEVLEGKTVLRRRDPIVKACPTWFAELESDRPDVEEATARPGQKRGE